MNLYSRRTLRASFVVVLIAVMGLTIVMAQRKSQHRLRATALVELTTDARGTKSVKVIPITILDQGNFHDASFYKAAPEPMALGPGVVYEAEKNGLPVGFATVSSASVRNGVWTAEGRWQPASDKPKASKSATPAANPADERPRLHRAGSSGGSSQATPAPTPVTPAGPQSGSSDDRPTLHRHEDASGQASPSPSPSASQTTANPSPTATPAESSPASSASDDPDRPLLRRGKPEPRPEPTVTSSAAQPSGSASGTKPSNTSIPAPPGTQVLVAVSDASPDDSRSFQFMWKPGEEAPIDAKIRHLAAAELAKGEGGTAGSSVSEQALRNVEVRSFDLDLSNDAVLVLSAELPPGSSSNVPKPAGRARSKSKSVATSETPPNSQVTRYVTLIARVDLDGNPQVLSGSVTDSSHLDVAPRLQLIDAVDVDGDGVGELLFREYDFDNKTFIVYAVRHGTLTKLFEGASQPIK